MESDKTVGVDLRSAGPSRALAASAWLAVVFLALSLALGCSSGEVTPSPGATSASGAGYRVEDGHDDCFTRPRTGQVERVVCEGAVDITAVEFRRDRIILEAVSPIVASEGRTLEFTAVMDIAGQGRLMVMASSLPAGSWQADCSLGRADVTPLPGGCRASTEDRALVIDLSPFEVVGEVSVGLLDISYFKETDLPGVGDFVESAVTFTLE
jgi:hypothetical protein